MIKIKIKIKINIFWLFLPFLFLIANLLIVNNFALQNDVEVVEILPFDGSMQLKVAGKEQYVSEKIAENILVVRG